MTLCDIVKIKNCRNCPFHAYIDCEMESVEEIADELKYLKESAQNAIEKIIEE